MLSRIGLILLLLSIMFADGTLVVPTTMVVVAVGLIWLGKGFEDETDAER